VDITVVATLQLEYPNIATLGQVVDLMGTHSSTYKKKILAANGAQITELEIYVSALLIRVGAGKL